MALADAPDPSTPLLAKRINARARTGLARAGTIAIALGVVAACAAYALTGAKVLGSASTSLGGARAITFRVFTCGIPQSVQNGYIPWPICRVKLVGCPGTSKENCAHWRFTEGLEMTPTSESRDVFEITTDKFGTGDVFGFAVIEAGCGPAEEAACAPWDCKDLKMCDHRYDSGVATPSDFTSADITCWPGNERNDAGSRCWSKSPFATYPPNDSCFVKMDKWYNRVVPADVDVVSWVWGTCLTVPEDGSACASDSTKSMCSMLGTVSNEIKEYPDKCHHLDGTVAHGAVCKLSHRKPGSDFSVEGSCCEGKCCANGQMCNRITKKCEDMRSALPNKVGMCTDPYYPQTYGVCTQSCGTGNGDCDSVCIAARDSGLTLSCNPGSTGSDACICSNIGGHTAEECKNEANPGFKCCTCKSIASQRDNNGNGWGRGGNTEH